MNNFSCGIRIWAKVFFCFVTIHAFDRHVQTDRHTKDRRTENPRKYRVLHYMQSRGKNVR